MLKLDLAPSRYLALLLTLGHAVAVLGVWLIDLPLAWKGLLSLLLLGRLLWVLWHVAWRRATSSIIQLQAESDGTLLLVTRQGQAYPATVAGASFVTAWLTVVVYRMPSQHYSRALLIMPDVTAATSYRKLRVWLKWRVGAGEQPAPTQGWAGRL